jgi:hypothetical protein
MRLLTGRHTKLLNLEWFEKAERFLAGLILGVIFVILSQWTCI